MYLPIGKVADMAVYKTVSWGMHLYYKVEITDSESFNEYPFKNVL